MSESSPLLYDKKTTGQAHEPWLSKHMLAMTAEGLHSKAEIAIELARRDKKIDQLLDELEYCAAMRANLLRRNWENNA